MSNITPVIAYFNELPEVKRLKALEPYIEGRKEIQELFQKMKDIQKKMVSSREFQQWNQLEIQEKEYLELKSQLFEIPFVEEYLELVEIISNQLKDFSLAVEDSIQI